MTLTWAMQSSGKFILLFGTSCAGKTTIGRGLQAQAREHFLLFSLDSVFAMVAPRWAGGPDGPLAAEGFAYRTCQRDDEQPCEVILCGRVGRNIIAGMRRAAAAFARAGANVIFDDMFLSPDAFDDWAVALKDLDAVSIQVTAPIEVLQARELARVRQRRRGLALGHQAMNEHFEGDLVIDTHALSVDEAVERVLQQMQSSGTRALETLSSREAQP